MNMYRLSDLLNLSAVQQVAEAHYRAAGMPIGIIDAIDDSILVGAGWQDICVKFHRANPESLKKCQASDNYIKDHLVEGQACRYKCKNGLWDIGVPILVAGQHLATMFLGQFFYEGEIPERKFFMRQAREFGFDLEGYLSALDRVPIFTHEKVEYIVEYNRALVGFITDIAEQTLAKMKADEAVLKQQYFLNKAQEIGHIGTWELDFKKNELTGTDEIYRIFGIPFGMDLTYENLLNCVHPDDREYVELKRDALLKAKIHDIEYRILVDGNVKWVKRKAELEFNEKYECIRATGVVQDITDRKLAEEALLESEKRLRLSLTGSGASFWEWFPENGYIYFDGLWAKIMDYSPAEKIFDFKVWMESIHPESKPLFSEALNDYLEGRVPRYESEYKIRTKTGAWKWIWFAGECVEWDKNKKPVRFIGIQRDITARKQAEEKIHKLNEKLEARIAERTAEIENRRQQLQRLALELTDAENRERQHIASILHDDFQQQLAYIKIEIGLMAKDNVGREAGKKLSFIEQLIGECIEKSRSLSYEINPPALNRNGLSAALDVLSQDMEDKHDLLVNLRIQPDVEPDSITVASILYRSAKELLFNVVKHSGVKSALMEVRCQNGMIDIRIEDFGKGFDYNATRSSQGRGAGFGLYQIEDRITFLGGALNIKTSPGKGCCAVLSVPKDVSRKTDVYAPRLRMFLSRSP